MRFKKIYLWMVVFVTVIFVTLYYKQRMLPTTPLSSKVINETMNLDKKLINPILIESPNEILIHVISSSTSMRIYVDDKILYVSPVGSVGISLLVMDPETLVVKKIGHFNTYAYDGDSDRLTNAIETCDKGDLVILGVVDEAFNKLDDKAKGQLLRQGSKKILELKFRSSWCMVFIKDKNTLGESITHRKKNEQWPSPTQLYVNYQPTNGVKKIPKPLCPNWPNLESFNRRRMFCQKHKMDFITICQCHGYSAIDFPYRPLENIDFNSKISGLDINEVLQKTPIVIVASNRPIYLVRCLQRLLSINGVRKNMIKIYTDSKNPIVTDIAKLFNLNIHITTKKCDRSCEIAHHYHAILKDVSEKNPNAMEIIIIEEDLLVSLDFFDYFSQVLPFYRTNEHYYCVSAWNDQSYNHTLGDYKMLYLTHTMPGLGFAIKRSIVVNEWLPNWPKSGIYFDWDYFVRDNRIRKGRECIVPDISRTFHFGEWGYSINQNSQKIHFNTKPALELINNRFDTSWLENNSYESLMVFLIRNAIPAPIKTVEEICNIGSTAYKNTFGNKHKNPPYAYPPTNGLTDKQLLVKTRTAYFNMGGNFDQKKWRIISKCCHIWDYDERDFHNGALRIWFSGVHYIIIMCPTSVYCKFMPNGITPIEITKQQ